MALAVLVFLSVHLVIAAGADFPAVGSLWNPEGTVAMESPDCFISSIHRGDEWFMTQVRVSSLQVVQRFLAAAPRNLVTLSFGERQESVFAQIDGDLVKFSRAVRRFPVGTRLRFDETVRAPLVLSGAATTDASLTVDFSSMPDAFNLGCAPKRACKLVIDADTMERPIVVHAAPTKLDGASKVVFSVSSGSPKGAPDQAQVWIASEQEATTAEDALQIIIDPDALDSECNPVLDAPMNPDDTAKLRSSVLQNTYGALDMSRPRNPDADKPLVLRAYKDIDHPYLRRIWTKKNRVVLVLRTAEQTQWRSMLVPRSENSAPDVQVVFQQQQPYSGMCFGYTWFFLLIFIVFLGGTGGGAWYVVKVKHKKDDQIKEGETKTVTRFTDNL